MLGPIDYIVVGFRGNQFDGSIMDELERAVDAGIIRVVDLVFIMKDADGIVAIGEFEDQPPELRQAFDRLGISGDEPLFTEEDLDTIAERMDNNTAAGLLVLEHLWAKGLKKALADAGGVLIADGRIHSAVAEAAAQEMAAAK